MGTVSNRGTKERPLWYIRYVDSDGKRKQRPSHQSTKKDALRFLAEVEARVARREIGIPEPSLEEMQRRTITVRQLADRFLAEYDPPRLRSRKRYMELASSSCNQRLFPYAIASMVAAAVKKRDVEAYRDALRRASYANKTINLTLQWLSRIFTWAIDAELVECTNPVSRVERLRTEPSTDHYTCAQVAALLSTDEPHPMIATALYTGMRKGELYGLTWACVRFDLGRIEIRRSFDGPPKNGKPRTIPLHPELAPILKAWQSRCPQTPQSLVFPVKTAKGYRPAVRGDTGNLRPILAAAGCPGDLDRPWHAMRHTFATMFCESGGAPDALSRILGHSAGGNAITSGYIHVSIDYLARELARLTLRSSTAANVISLQAFRQTS